MLKQKYSESLLKASTLKAKKILPVVSRQPQTTKNYKIIPFITTNNPNNPNMFPRIKKRFGISSIQKKNVQHFLEGETW